MIDEGVIKFDMRFERSATVKLGQWQEIERIRYRLRYLGYIGEYEQFQIGFGNISTLAGSGPHFVITGTQTGKKTRLTRNDFCLVTRAIVDRNYVECTGPAKASSEAMTHAMLYSANAQIRAIIHVHNKKLWQALMHREPTTAADVPYGTVEMAGAVRDILQREQKPYGTIVMAGHEDGIIYYGQNLDQALQILMKHHYNSKRE